MRMMPFGCAPDKVANEAGGFTLVSLHNLPAFREEPAMPPEYSAKQWILIYYEENDNTGKDKYWKSTQASCIVRCRELYPSQLIIAIALGTLGY